MLLGMRQGPFGDPSPVINWDFLQSQSLTSFSRTSNATLFDSTGKLTYAANNMCTYSQTLSNSAWQAALLSATLSSNLLAPDGSSTAGKLAANGATDAVRYCNTPAPSPGLNTYIFSIYAKAGEFSWFFLDVYSGPELKVWFDLTNGVKGTITGGSATYDMVPVGNGWYRCYVKFTSSISSITARLASGDGVSSSGATASGNGIYLWGAQLEAVTYQTTPSTYVATTTAPYYGPRYPYAYNGTTWDAQGLLVEAAATNLVTYSNTFNSWSPINVPTPTLASVVSPDGTTNAWELKDTTSNTEHRLFSSNPTITGTSVTVSIYAKQNTLRYLCLNMQRTGNIQYSRIFDLQTGTKGSEGTYNSPTGTKSDIVNVGNGWWRLSIGMTVVSGDTVSINLYTSDTSSNLSAYGVSPSYAGNGSGLYIYGAQIEAGDLPTSYIPNLSTGTTTRNADTSLAFSAISLPTGLSFSRASNAMQYDAAGRLTYAPNNLLTYSNDFSNGAWTKWSAGNGVTPTLTGGQADPLGGSNGWRLQCSGVSASGDRSAIYQSTTNNASANIITIWAKSNTGASQTVAFVDYNAISGGAITVTTSWKQFSISATGANSGIIFGSLGYTSGTGGTIDILIYAPTISLVTYETVARPCDQLITTTDPKYGPRYDYDPLTRLPKGLLIEEGRTNYCPRSNEFTNTAWGKGANINIAGGVSDPAGGNNAFTITATASGSFNVANYIYTSAGIGAVTGTNSIWMRRRSGTGTVAFAPPTGAQNNVTLTSSWQRLSASAAVAATAYLQIDVLTSGDQIDIYGAQIEIGSFPTSYIPTTSASVARSADIATLTGTALTTLQGSTGSVLAEFNTQTTSDGTRIIGSASATPMQIYSGSLNWYNVATNAAYPGATVVVGTTMRGVIGWLNGASLSYVANGGTVGTNSSTSGIGSTYTSAYLGNDNGNQFFLNGYVRRVGMWNVRLSNAKLQTKSVVGATL